MRLIQASAGEPEKAEQIKPTGTLRFFCRSRPKKYATAENGVAVVGEETDHCPAMLVPGVADCVRGIVNRRRFGFAAAAIAAAPVSASGSGRSMFDCPLHSHTSPTTTLPSVIRLVPCTVSAAPLVVAVSGANFTDQLPPRATVETTCAPKLTVTASPSSAQPHTFTGTPCCSTMLEVNKPCRRTVAPA